MRAQFLSEATAGFTVMSRLRLIMVIDELRMIHCTNRWCFTSCFSKVAQFV